PDLPQAGSFHPFEVLGEYPAARNLRYFQFGVEVDPEEWEYRARTNFELLSPFVERLPRLEELHVFASNQMGRAEGGGVFSLRSLTNLRVLRHYHGYYYPLLFLADNPALGRLTHLLCYPNARARQGGREGWDAAISRAGVRAVCWSPHLKSLTHLQLRCCDGGDEMVEDIIFSGILRRLKLLDLRHGRISDDGAKMLAKCPEVKGMEIDLVNNRLTDRGISELLLAGAKLRSEDQQKRPYKTTAMFRGEFDVE